MINAPLYEEDTTAFNAYAYRTSELDKIVDDFISNYYATGETSYTAESEYAFSDADIAYIEREIKNRI